MRRALLAPLALAIVVAAPAFARSTHTAVRVTALDGVVIARSAHQGEIVVASARGRTSTVRAASLPAPGAVIRASVFRLADGTSAAARLRVVGRTHHARFRGVLVKTSGRISFFATGRSVVAVSGTLRTSASTRSLSDAAPLTPGSSAEIEVTISGGSLEDDTVTPMPEGDESQVTLQVTITDVTPATSSTDGSITLVIDGQTLVVPLPAGTVLPSSFVPDATVALTISFDDSGASATGGSPSGDDGGGEPGDDDQSTTTTTTATIPTTTSATIPTTMPETTTTTTIPEPGDDGATGDDDQGPGGSDDGGGDD